MEITSAVTITGQTKTNDRTDTDDRKEADRIERYRNDMLKYIIDTLTTFGRRALSICCPRHGLDPERNKKMHSVNQFAKWYLPKN